MLMYFKAPVVNHLPMLLLTTILYSKYRKLEYTLFARTLLNETLL